MRETGLVVETKGPTARVRVEPAGACESCAGKHACAGASGRPFEVEAENACEAQAGDIVELDMTPAPMWAAILLVFAGPLLLLFIGLAAGYRVSRGDAGAAVGAAAGLTAGFVLMSFADRLLAARREFRPTIVRVLPRD